MGMRFYFLWVFILLASCATEAQNKPTLTILSHTYFSQELDEKISSENISQVISPALDKEFNVVFEFTNHARLIRKLSSSIPVCTFNSIKTPEREVDILFSAIPTFMHVQRELFTLKSSSKNWQDTVSVKQLLDKNLVLGLVGSTSYQALDPLIAEHKSSIAFIWGENSFKQLGELLINKRVDMILDYKSTLQEHLSEEQLSLIRSHKVIEYPDYVNGYFACSKTPQGSKAIKLIEQYLRTSKMSDYLHKIHHESNSKEVADKMMATYEKKYNIKLSVKNSKP